MHQRGVGARCFNCDACFNAEAAHERRSSGVDNPGDDCGKCYNCKQKRKFGGSGIGEYGSSDILGGRLPCTQLFPECERVVLNRWKSSRWGTCGKCRACKRMQDCGKCKYCKDRPGFGGRNHLKQKCALRQCTQRKKKRLAELATGARKRRAERDRLMDAAAAEDTDSISDDEDDMDLMDME